MKKLVSNGWLAVIVIVSLLVIDQVIKIGVKTNMYLYESIRITDWFYIHFIENNGMARRRCRKHLRLNVLRTCLQRFVTVLRKLPCSFRSRLCLVPYGQGSRYVLLPHNRDDAPRVASLLGRSALCVLQPCIQLCRCLYMCCGGAVAAVLP